MDLRSDIVGYTFNTENVCTDCVLQPEDIGHVFSVDAVLDVVARFMDIDRSDENSFDSGTFPKVIYADQVKSAEKCDKCGARFI